MGKNVGKNINLELAMHPNTPQRLKEWNTKVKVWNMTSLFKEVILRFHMNFPVCRKKNITITEIETAF